MGGKFHALWVNHENNEKLAPPENNPLYGTPEITCHSQLWLIYCVPAIRKLVSTDQLRNLPMIASVSASGINAIAHWNML